MWSSRKNRPLYLSRFSRGSPKKLESFFFPNSEIEIFDDFEKCVLELCRTAKIKPRQIERSAFFLLDHNGQTQVYRLVLGPPDVWLLRNHDFPMEEEDCAPPRVN